MTKVNRIVKELKPKVTGDKYLQVTTGNGRQEYVHRLMAEAEKLKKEIVNGF